MNDNLARFFFFSTIFVGALSVEWDNLRVHFGNPFNSKSFVKMPRNTRDALDAGWKFNGTLIDSCKVEDGYLGLRYVNSKRDRSAMLLFDIQGTIAGIQTAIPKSSGVPTAAMKKFHDVYLETETEHLLTAYFVDPSLICHGGRSKEVVEVQGTGDRMVIQVGRITNASTPKVMEIPKQESGVSATKWTKGKCFIMMGQHYWYNMRQDMDCADFFPVFTLYNKGKLNGFGFAINANYQGQYYEHPTLGVANKFFPSIPTCMNQPGFPNTFTTMHVYMYSRPWWTNCWF